LFASGGPNNPFSLFYFVNLSLSAIVLSRAWAWRLNWLSIGCFTLLIFLHDEIDQLQMGIWMLPVQQTGHLSILQWGFLIAFATSASIIVYFMTQLADEMRQQESDLRAAQQQQARSEKLEALGTLAAGTAHELATPLSTIAVVARDVEHFFETHPLNLPGAAEVVEDIHLIRNQLDRCRSILDRMSGQAGQPVGESIQIVTVAEFWEEVLGDLPERDRVQIALSDDDARETLRVPLIVLSQAIRGLVQNALDADSTGSGVRISVQRFVNHWHWLISDQGSGMSPSILQRISEPFFTTKQPGKGMGLGVFLCKNVLERLDGSLDFQSQLGVGTSVTVRLPRTSPSPTTTSPFPKREVSEVTIERKSDE
jgi:two-component system sensor histidine kinase RegB